MKAAIFTKYGPPEVLSIQEVPKPTPKKNELLVHVKASAVNAADWRLRKADPFVARFFVGLFKPKKQILGVTFSGVVEDIGENVTVFQKGQNVFGSTEFDLGAHAEYVCVRENGAISPKPSNLTHEEAASVPFGGSTALYFLRKANVQKGERILVYGASGAVGTAAVQLGKYFGADVHSVCSTTNIDLMKTLGVSQAIDYSQEGWQANLQKYDVVVETVGKLSLKELKDLVKPKGRLVLIAGSFGQMIVGLFTRRFKIISGVATESTQGAEFLATLAESKQLLPVIDTVYDLKDIASAHRHAEGGHKKGNVVIRI